MTEAARDDPSEVVVFALFDIAAAHRAWGWWQFVVGRRRLRRVAGLRFGKQLGSGQSGGFGLKPSASIQGLFAVFDDAASAEAFCGPDGLLQQWRLRAREHVCLRLRTCSARGSWDGTRLAVTASAPDEGPVVVAWTRRATNNGAQWLRWQSPPVRTRAQWQEAWAQAAQWARTPGDAERRYEVALIPIDGWQVFYYRGGSWSNALSSAGTPQGTAPGVAQGADPSSAIPEGIRLQLTLSPGGALSGQLVRDWVSPLVGGRRT